MRVTNHIIRKVIISQLAGSVELDDSYIVPVYNRVPSNATYPFIRVYSVSTNDVDRNQTSYNNEVITRIEVVTRFESDSGGELQCNEIVDLVTGFLFIKDGSYFNPLPSPYTDDYKVYTATLEGITYLQDDLSDHTYFRAIIEMSNRIEEL